MIPRELSEIEGLREISPLCGVYFLCSNGAVVYVGQSTNVHARIADHRSCKISFDQVFFLAARRCDLDRVEREFIEKLLPRLNLVGITRCASRRPQTGVEEWPRGSGRFRVDYYDGEGKRRRKTAPSLRHAIILFRKLKTEAFKKKLLAEITARDPAQGR